MAQVAQNQFPLDYVWSTKSVQAEREALDAESKRKQALVQLASARDPGDIVSLRYPLDEWLTPEHYLVCRTKFDNIKREEFTGMHPTTVPVFLSKYSEEILQRRRYALSALKMEMCCFDKQSAQIIGEILKTPRLRILELPYCQISTELLSFVIAGLEENRSLLQLVLDGNPIGEAGGRALLKCFKRNAYSPLTANSVSLEGTGIPEGIRLAIVAELGAERRMETRYM